MGKKALEEIGKVLIGSMISILLTTMVVRRALIDSKLDKSEFNTFKAEHSEQHKQEHEDIEYVRGKVDDIYKYLLEKDD